MREWGASNSDDWRESLALYLLCGILYTVVHTYEYVWLHLSSELSGSVKKTMARKSAFSTVYLADLFCELPYYKDHCTHYSEIKQPPQARL